MQLTSPHVPQMLLGYLQSAIYTIKLTEHRQKISCRVKIDLFRKRMLNSKTKLSVTC